MLKIFQSNFGNISYYDMNSNSNNCLLLIHGLSCSKEIFHYLINNLYSNFRILSIDLLGHGESENSKNKKQSYSISGFADSIIELLADLKIKNLNIYGWSIGGNIALEILDKYNFIQNVILDGYSPCSYIEKNFDKVFIFNEATPLIGKNNLTKNEAKFYVSNGGLKSNSYQNEFKVDKIVENVLRADGEMREYWYKSVMNLEGISPKECVEKHRKKIKILIGEEDPGIQLNYLKENFDDISIFFKNVGHAVFWDKPEEVKKIIYTFFNVIFYI
ncbi:alpha/beta fold hydrolase [Silvanigrella paludirubra]|uniref:Alpha/beta fold hydrolase n=1 Tax=Silvanigrella paludirubra TaxID=2499159 RepID=A0A6N6VVV9_9BACT|nr:alpha/beta hydrolase [Silvanigrella paludirubra]KAB8040755.1 alpha/beta fold hydrolase [Silvanigrella paludirubra]